MSNQIACVNMIKQQLRTGNVHTASIIALYENIPRAEFVPSKYQPFAYSDMHIPLAHDQCMMTPLEEALLLQSLELKGHETVLEIGTGTGFLTAMLSRLSKKVVSVDCHPEFTKNAQQALAAHGCTNVQLITGNASSGWLDLAPYDVIIFSGALRALTETQRLQLLPGGKLFAIIGTPPVMRAQLYTLDHEGQWATRLVFETCVPSLSDALKSNHFVF